MRRRRCKSEAEARWCCLTSLIASGSSYHLQRNVIALQAEGAVARSAGLLLAADAALEHQVRLSHGAARTTSAIEDLALASGSARAVVNAHTRIAPGAAQADVRPGRIGARPPCRPHHRRRERRGPAGRGRQGSASRTCRRQQHSHQTGGADRTAATTGRRGSQGTAAVGVDTGSVGDHAACGAPAQWR